MLYRTRILLCFFLGIAGILYAGGPRPQIIGTEVAASSATHFIENKGQWGEAIRFMADIPGGRVFAEPNRLTYNFVDTRDLHERYFHRDEHRNTPLLFNCHAFRVNFSGANPSPRITGSDLKPEYNNYFIGNDPSKWAGNVPLWGQITYEQLYPGIDLDLIGKSGSLKYQFRLRAGADPGLIRLEFEGADRLEVDAEGQLHVHTSLGEIVEQAPLVFYESEEANIIPCRFVVQGNVLTYEFPQGYEIDRGLVIDPTLIFSTFTGSTGDNFGYTATYDDLGNFYAGGIVFGAGYPITVGAYQTAFGGGGIGGAWNFNGGIDISLTKYNPTGTARVWSTYLGGTANEQPHSLITNAAGELFIYGETWSGNYPVTAGCYQNTLAGAGDILVTRMNAAGNALVASTFVGGAGEDGMNVTTIFGQSGLKWNYGDDARGEIMLDNAGNVYIASTTHSNNFPTVSAFQPAFGGGLQDGCAFKLNGNMTTLVWSTYLGGSADDACYSIKVDASSNAFVTGGTASLNFPTTAGAYQAANAGGIDGFITHIAANGSSLLASSYIGTSAYDQSYFVELDNAGDVYLYGQSLGAFPVSAGVYSNPGAPQFLMKMTPALNAPVWSTVFGVAGSGAVNISPTALLVDICGFVYISGWGGSVNHQGNTFGMDLTIDAYQSTTDGSDFYLMVLEKDAQSLVYGSYFGGAISPEHVDGGTSRFNRNLEIYQAVCAGCGGNSDFPTTPGCVSPTNNSTNCNEGTFKFAFDSQTVIAAYIATPFDSCAPFPVTFVNQSIGGVFYIWNYGDGSPQDTTFTPSNVGHTYSTPGSYFVTLTVVDSNSCNVSDSIIQTVTVHANPISSSSGGGNVCSGGAIQLYASGGNSYQWLPAAGLSNNTVPNPIASPFVNTNYMVIVTDSFGCVDTSYALVTVSTYQADAGPPSSFCEGTGGTQLVAGIPNGGTGPYWYEWWCDTTTTWCGLDSVFDNDPIANPNGSTWYYLQVTDFFGCLSEIDSVLVTVLPLPIVDAGPDQWICADSAPGAFLSPSIYGAPGPYDFYWTPGTGLNDSLILSPYARPDTTTMYTLYATSSNGCTSVPTTVDTLSTVTVHVYPLPIAEAGPDTNICFQDAVMFQGYGYGAGPDYLFEWSPATGLNDSTLSNPTATPPATTDYVLVVWSNGCPSHADTITVFVHTLPTINAGPDRDICLGDSAQLDAQAGGDPTASFYNYVWTPNISLSNDSIEDPLASPPVTTTYYVQGTSSWGCRSGSDSMLVTIKPTPLAEAGPPLEICEGDSVTLLGSYYYTTTDSANPSQIWYEWAPPATLSNALISQPNAGPTQSTQYYLLVHYNTCTTEDSVLVTVKPDVNATAGADTSVICGGDSVNLFATGGQGGATFTWTPPGSLSNPGIATPSASPDTSTTWWVVVTEGGCADTLPVTVNVIPRPDLAMMSSLTEGCVPFPVNFLELANDAIFFTWHFGDGSISNEQNPTHVYTQPGTYTVTLVGQNSGACESALSTITIEVSDTAHADFHTNPLLPLELPLPGSTVDFFEDAQNAVSWLWNFGDGTTSDLPNPAHLFTDSGTYYVTLTVTNDRGCRGTITKGPVIITIPDLFIPNVFSPNEDFVNDVFFVQYSGSQPFQLYVLDRWGNKLFTTNNPHQGWDGKVNGQKAPEGVYYYLVKVGEQDYVGPVTLLR